ncbi:hypothetical protein LCGC14_1572510, partial [marine sediment metagenome]
LFDVFFGKYDREVLMLVGRKRDHSGWLYHIPKQIGSPGFVRWSADDEEMGIFSDKAQWIGTIHIHPGADCTPSQTDIDDWAEPEKSGLHLIFGRGGSYGIYGSIAGQTFRVYKSELGRTTRAKAYYTTSQGRSLAVLLTKPKPKPKPKPKSVFKSWPLVTSRSTVGTGTETETEMGTGKSYVERNLHAMRVSPISHDELQSLRMVSHGGQYYILTELQYECLGELCVDVCPLPTAGNLVIRSSPGHEKELNSVNNDNGYKNDGYE